MKQRNSNLTKAISLAAIILLSLTVARGFSTSVKSASHIVVNHEHGEDLQQKAFIILNSKCNVCHRKKNPFMVFTEKNMKARAKRIHKQVFVKKRMPKGNEIQLTKMEYQTLKNWLITLNIQ